MYFFFKLNSTLITKDLLFSLFNNNEEKLTETQQLAFQKLLRQKLDIKAELLQLCLKAFVQVV